MKLIKDLIIGDKVFFYDIHNKSISITEVMVDRIGFYCPHNNKRYYLGIKFNDFSLMISNGYIILTEDDLNIINGTLNIMINYMNYFSFILLLSLHNHTEFTTVSVTNDDCDRLINYDSRDSLEYNIKLLFKVLSDYNIPRNMNCDTLLYFSDIFGKLSIMVYDIQKYINILEDFIYLIENNYINYNRYGS